MTELEQYKKAYTTLVGRVDTVITDLECIDKNFVVEKAAAAYTVGALTDALQEARDIFKEEAPEGG